MEQQAKDPEISPEMLDRAMAQLYRYDLASEYIDKDMMRQILAAALRTPGPTG